MDRNMKKYLVIAVFIILLFSAVFAYMNIIKTDVKIKDIEMIPDEEDKQGLGFKMLVSFKTDREIDMVLKGPNGTKNAFDPEKKIEDISKQEASFNLSIVEKGSYKVIARETDDGEKITEYTEYFNGPDLKIKGHDFTYRNRSGSATLEIKSMIFENNGDMPAPVETILFRIETEDGKIQTERSLNESIHRNFDNQLMIHRSIQGLSMGEKYELSIRIINGERGYSTELTEDIEIPEF